MRFGLFYEHQLPRPWEDGDEERLLRDALEQVELADRAGIDYVWEVEHHFLEEYSHSSAPEVFLAAASQRTSNIRLGHGIVQLPSGINHPARVAERIATLDLVSGGRVDFGTGEGSSQVELGGFGVDRQAKRDQWAESLDVVVRMLSEEPFGGHRGTWIDVPPRNVVPKPKQKPHPPLWVACSRRETILMAARKGLGALSFSFVDPADAKALVDGYYEIIESGEIEPAGLSVNPNVAVVVPFMCHPDEETAIERGIDGAHFFGYSLAHYYVFGDHEPGRTDVWSQFQRYREDRGFAREIIRAEKEPLGMKVVQQGIGSLRGAVGTPDQITDLIQRYADVGVDQVILVAQSGRNRHEHICESIELFADQVLPRFTEGREEAEARKAERLSETIDKALARRAPARPAPSGYVASPSGEPAAARPSPIATPVASQHHDVRSVTREMGRAALGAVVRRMDDDRLARLGPSLLPGVFNSMARGVDPAETEQVDATIQWELSSPDGTHTWAIRIRHGRASARRTVVEAPDLRCRSTLVDFLRIVAGDVQAGKAIMDERLVLEGSEVALLTLVGGDRFY